ncbi:N-acetylmuramoyl-L-alanine amidase/uncharacterized protein YjdB [Faecalicoccus acidiformans]|uniref:N-acetylmuramoyl-L-alanine amidase/uncharacterized protein YjdB n=1 Tax=Faecalicoccus acidiformans TaxID=915173 RepID=A0A7W8D306_9FIRM|nr:N-acetylmuramoyl-L-alanine amidase [Faecalicoccus acidiformans]MBB5185013.1 N-acetylmuramoyl-L-alanine amidase/uncharacterized protein YjdB [Faecalicoccus acidiformans]
MFKFLKKSLSFVMILMLVTSLVSNVYALDFISSDNADTNEIVENQNLNQAEEENAIEDSESEGSNNTEDKGSNLNDDSSVMENQAAEKNVQSLQEQHNVEDSIPEEKNIIVQPGDSSLVEYFYVGSPYLTTPATQQFILSFGTGAERITSVKLEYQKDGEEELSLDVARQQSNLYVFERSFTEAESGTYKVNGFTYVIDNQTYEVSFSDLEMDIRFGVNQEYEGYGTAEGYTVDANGNEVQEESIDTQGLSEAEIDTSVVTLDGSNADQTEALVEDALQNNALPSVQSRSRSNSITTYSETNPLVICIDPGHGGNDSGTIIVNGAYEKNYNLKIAQYLKAELEQYKNVKVVMTRTGDTNPSLQQRAQIAADAGATALVSIHLNATGWGTQSTVAGAEVYYPSSNYNAATSTTGKNLAQNILNQLVGLGIQNRGIKVKYVYNTETGQPAHHPAYDYPDGSVGDYYGVIRYSKLVGVSGIIVEHCMADNWNDFNKFLSSEAKLKQLGVADATGIAKAFGLQKTPKAINYSVHCQTYGWMNTVGDGQTAGTTGQAKRLESIKISLGETGYSGGVQYRTHVQTYGWQGWKQNGQESGTTGQAKRLEAIQIKLTGDVANYYDVYYRTHVQKLGWLGWAKNGESSGSSGYAYRMEGIEIVLVKKGGSAPGSTSNAYKTKQIKYQTHVQTYGWQGEVNDGALSGTSGQAKRLESIKISLGETGYSGGVQYRTHVQTYGWQGWKQNGQESGTTGQAKRLEAIQIKLTGDVANYYDVYYRTHVQKLGWLGWAKNGESSGSSGYAYRMEGIEIVLVKKGGSAPGSTSNAYHDKNAQQAKGYKIMGTSSVSAKQLANYYNSYKGSATYDKYTGSNAKYNGTLSKGGAATIEQFCQIFLEECQAEGVKAEVAFAQAMHETGFLKFGGDVLPNQYNFAGLGATGNGTHGNSFKDVRTGIRAQVQHLKCYASTEPLNQAKVDPRWSDSLRGKAPTVEKLQGTWATSNTYASSLMTGINRILKS